MNTIIFVLALTLLFCCSLFIEGAKQKKAVIDFNVLEIENFYKELAQISYNINYTEQNISTLNVNLVLNEDVKSINGAFNLRILHAGKYRNFTGIEFDCEVLGMIYNHYILNIVFAGLRSSSNLPLRCPFIKNKLYYLNGFKIVTNLIPSYFPGVSFQTYATISYNQRLIMGITTRGKLRRI
ncbi:uncharacterized protein LOC132785249 [Drosophila nasuta]|uniref:uncharacterized protein LOC132785249 n=1 Tax=Drosophila nasuta TaxID=42062 RepID=UPI00295F00F8|nr:uncharacterized protein LOC132785249 [Drosophila nasuta]